MRFRAEVIRFIRLALWAVLAPALVTPASADEAARVIQLLASGDHIAVMRHAAAPGTFDPPGFSLDDCATQRNLSEEGRAQARRVGERLRAAGLATARVFTSRHCRTRDTAQLLGYGMPTELPQIFAFSPSTPNAEQQTAELRAWIAAQPRDPAILVTHSFNISALTDQYLADAEIVVLGRTPGGALIIKGRIRTE